MIKVTGSLPKMYTDGHFSRLAFVDFPKALVRVPYISILLNFKAMLSLGPL